MDGDRLSLEDRAQIEMDEARERNPGPEETAKMHEGANPKTFSTFAPSVESRPKVIITRGDSVRPESVDWIWNGWLAAGKMALIGGAPGCGKTTIAGALGSTITMGGRWPDGSRAEHGRVVIWSGEDGIEDTLAPRMIAAGADMSRVHFISGVQEKGVTYPFDPSKDMEPLEEAIASLDNVRLLIVDPIVSATSGDSHKNAEVRRGLQPLVDLAGKMRCALLGVTHFTKGTQGRDPVERITGSLAFGALARLVMVAAVGEPKEGRPPERLLVRAKSNLGPNGDGFTYAVEHGALLPGYPDIISSRVLWGSPVTGTARELLEDAEQVASSTPARESAKEWLIELLSDGPVSSDEIKKGAKDSGHTWGTVRNAKDEIRAKSRKSAMAGGWVWELPEGTKNPRRGEGANDSGVSTFGETVSTFGAEDYRRASGGE